MYVAPMPPLIVEVSYYNPLGRKEGQSSDLTRICQCSEYCIVFVFYRKVLSDEAVSWYILGDCDRRRGEGSGYRCRNISCRTEVYTQCSRCEFHLFAELAAVYTLFSARFFDVAVIFTTASLCSHQLNESVTDLSPCQLLI